MRVSRSTTVVWTIIAIGCASASRTAQAPASAARAPLGARLTADAPTGAPVPLRIDPNARVVRSLVPNLPAATYWPAQADRGERVFNGTCAACHARAQFIGQTFVDAWNDRRVSDFYTLIRSTMPVNDPGSLKDEEYLAVVSYLLKANHAAAGTDSLAADSGTVRGRRIAVKAP
jgi:mono/diheme cytochrome c family protein